MTDNSDLSVYELGVIHNALRNKIIRLEFERNCETTEDFEKSEETDIFCAELLRIKLKISHLISNR